MAYTPKPPDMTQDSMKLMSSEEVIKRLEAAGMTVDPVYPVAGRSDQLKRLFKGVHRTLRQGVFQSVFKLYIVLGAVELGLAGLLKVLGGEGTFHLVTLTLFHIIGLYAILYGCFLLSTMIVYVPVFSLARIFLGSRLFPFFLNACLVCFVASLTASPALLFLELPWYDGRLIVKLYTLLGTLGIVLSGILSIKQCRSFKVPARG